MKMDYEETACVNAKLIELDKQIYRAQWQGFELAMLNLQVFLLGSCVG
jgi:hypothetical protein